MRAVVQGHILIYAKARPASIAVLGHKLCFDGHCTSQSNTEGHLDQYSVSTGGDDGCSHIPDVL